jgi:hypothetical protein
MNPAAANLLQQAELALYAAGWAALLLAPLRFTFCWIFARSLAVILALLFLVQLVAGSATFVLWSQGDANLAVAALLPLTLFVGSWQVEDSAVHAIPHFALVPCLLLTAATGPVGFAAHILMRDGFKWHNRRRARASEQTR